jgi:hypothetical protein
LRKVFNLIVDVVEQHTGVQLVISHRFIGQFVGLAVKFEYYFLQFSNEGDLDHIALAELEGLSLD